MARITTILILFMSVVVSGSPFDPNSYQTQYSELNPDIHSMELLELSYYHSELISDCNSVILSARESVGLTPGHYLDPNSVSDLTYEQAQSFDYIVLLDRVEKRILDLEFERLIITKDDFDTLIIKKDNRIVSLICECLGLKYNFND